MMFGWIVLLVVIVGVSTILAYVFGFHLGQTTYVGEAMKVRREAAMARKAMADITRAAFLAMAEAAERQQRR